jgi:transposase
MLTWHQLAAFVPARTRLSGTPLARPRHEIGELGRRIKTNLDDVASPLVAVQGVGYDTAGQLLVTAGDHPDRLRHERSFAALCGSSPVPASSGKTDRHDPTAAATTTPTRRCRASSSSA